VSKRPTKAERERTRADEFCAEVKALHDLPGHDWNDWELDWQESEMRRPPFYIHSEKEEAVLARMRRDAKPFDGWDSYSTRELIRAALKALSRRRYNPAQARDGVARQHLQERRRRSHRSVRARK